MSDPLVDQAEALIERVEAADALTLYTLREAADLLKVTYRTIGKWRAAGALHVVRLGPGKRAPVRVPKAEILRFLRAA